MLGMSLSYSTIISRLQNALTGAGGPRDGDTSSLREMVEMELPSGKKLGSTCIQRPFHHCPALEGTKKLHGSFLSWLPTLEPAPRCRRPPSQARSKPGPPQLFYRPATATL